MGETAKNIQIDPETTDMAERDKRTVWLSESVTSMYGERSWAS